MGGGGAGLLAANAGGKAVVAKTAGAIALAGLGAGVGTLAVRTAQTHHHGLGAAGNVEARTYVQQSPGVPDEITRSGARRLPAMAGLSQARGPASAGGGVPAARAPVTPAHQTLSSAAPASGPDGARQTISSAAPASSAGVTPFHNHVSEGHSRVHPTALRLGAGAGHHQTAGAHARARHAPGNGASQYGSTSPVHGHRGSPPSSSPGGAARRSHTTAGHGGAPSTPHSEASDSTGSSRGVEMTNKHAVGAGASGSAPGHS
jgi:hypothetical protein